MKLTRVVCCYVLQVCLQLASTLAQAYGQTDATDTGQGTIKGTWGQWKNWSRCTVECGTGISVRTRRCVNPINLPVSSLIINTDSSVTCDGDGRQIKACNKQVCPPSKDNHRDSKCRKFNARVFNGRKYRWERYINPNKKCELTCRAKGHPFFARLANRAVDGTPCSVTSLAVCIRGKCTEIGCDGLFGSKTKRDMCGICRGDNSTCRTVSGIFTRFELPHGYAKIITIPAGSTNINVTELRPSTNYLAFISNNQSIVNGDWDISPSGKYPAAGTTFIYAKTSRKCPGQCAFVSGPTNQSVDLMLLVYQNNPGIMYSFNVPTNVTNTYFQQLIAHESPEAKRLSGDNVKTTGVKFVKKIVPVTESTVLSLSEYEREPLSLEDNSDVPVETTVTSVDENVGENVETATSESKDYSVVLKANADDALLNFKDFESQKEPSPSFVLAETGTDDSEADDSVNNNSDMVVTGEMSNENTERDSESENSEHSKEEKDEMLHEIRHHKEYTTKPRATATTTTTTTESQNALFISTAPTAHSTPRTTSRSFQPNQPHIPQRDSRSRTSRRQNVRIPKYSQSFKFRNRYRALIDAHRKAYARRRMQASIENQRIQGNRPSVSRQTTQDPRILDNARQGRNDYRGSSQRHRNNQRHRANQQRHGGHEQSNRRHHEQRNRISRILNTTPAPNVHNRHNQHSIHRGHSSSVLTSEQTPRPPHFGRHHPSNRHDAHTPSRHSQEVALQPNPGQSGQRVRTSNRHLIPHQPPMDPQSQRQVVLQQPIVQRVPVSGRFDQAIDPRHQHTDETLPQSSHNTHLGDSKPGQFDRAIDPRRPVVNQGRRRGRHRHIINQRPVVDATLPLDSYDPNFERGSSRGQIIPQQPISSGQSPGQDRAFPNRHTVPHHPLVNYANGADSLSGYPSISPPHQTGVDSREALTAGKTYTRNIVSNSNRLPALPIGQGVENDIHGSVYSWRISGLTECTTTCGGGVQQTVVVCVDRRTQAVVTDENCVQIARPAAKAVTCNTRPCPARWETGHWSACSVSCGSGRQTRAVVCKSRVSRTLNLTMSADSCAGQQRPSNVRVCEIEACFQWRTGNWTKCNTDCGRGTRQRDVTCVNNNGNNVRNDHCTGDKPSEEETCDMGSCGKGWFFTQWPEVCPVECGQGLKRRKAFCAAQDGTALAGSRCSNSEKPTTQKRCRSETPCGGTWFTGEWEKCNATCGRATKTRDVACVKHLTEGILAVVTDDNCKDKKKPPTEMACDLEQCRPEWYMTSWSECSASCGTGYRTREIKCLDSMQQPSAECISRDRPKSRESCNTHSCGRRPTKTGGGECKDSYSHCDLVKKSRLCRYVYYAQMCCVSCSNET